MNAILFALLSAGALTYTSVRNILDRRYAAASSQGSIAIILYGLIYAMSQGWIS